MRSILVMLMAIALLAVPAMAFEPTIPVSSIEAVKEQLVKDQGAYSFARTAVDVNYEFSPQFVYSGMLFGVDESGGVDPADYLYGGHGYTAGVVANDIGTNAYVYNEDEDPAIPDDEYIEGVNSGITRQYIQQGGSAYVTLTPGYDPENEAETTVDMGFTKTNLAWISGDLDLFEVTPQSYAAVGGNYLEAVPKDLSPTCQNAWLIEREKQLPITVEAVGESRLLEAYAGTASEANLVMTAEGKGSAAAATMSGYAERFAGYTDAKVNSYSGYDLNDWKDNSIVMDFGSAVDADGNDNTVEHFWITDLGVSFNDPDYEDFPGEEDHTFWKNAFVSWPDDEYTDEDLSDI